MAGDLFTLKEFIEDCESGCLIDYDGFGQYANKDGEVVIAGCVYPSDVDEGLIDREQTHVLWYNR